MVDIQTTAEIYYIRLRAVVMDVLQLISLLFVIVGAIRLFGPIVAVYDEPILNVIVYAEQLLQPLPDIGAATYMFSGFILYLVIYNIPNSHTRGR